jgi:hypothetical protein
MSSFSDDFGTDYCPYKSLMTSSKDSIIYANTETSKFYITRQSEHNGSKCEIPFTESSICGISVGKDQDFTKQWFIYWGFDEDNETYYVGTIYYSELSSHKCRHDYRNISYLSKDSLLFKVSNDGLMGYGFDYNSFYFYDIKSNQKYPVQPSTGSLSFTPSDISLMETTNQAIAIGYLKDGILSSSLMYATVCLWQLNSTNHSIVIINCTRLHNIGYHFSEYHPGPKLSVDINGNLIAIGNSASRSIEIFMFNDTEITNIHTFQSHVETNSICWLSDGHRIAAVSHSTSSPWSQSQVLIYDFDFMTHDWPELVFPNNQQELDSWSFKNPVFILASTWKQWNSLLILMNTQKILVILSTQAGSYADPLLYSWFDNPWIWIGLRNRRHGEQSSTPCWPGMYKEEENIIPCKVCPPNTKSQANSTICYPCNQTSFCPLASVDESNITGMIDIHEKTNYPQSPDSTQFEDILLTNMFSIKTSSRCILISPLFWTLIVISIGVLVLIIIGILKFFPKSHRHRKLVKQIFRQTDFIGQGEFWIGGLMSFSLLVLVIFAFLFSNEYVSLYPIEEANDPKVACDENLRNAQFDTSLKLLSATRSEEHQIIFDMLDNQSFTLIVNFVNTNFDCDLLNILEGTGYNLHEPISPMTCIQLNSSQIIHTSIPTFHEVTFRYTIKHFAPIGGLYICLIGKGNTTNDGMNIMKDMNFCRWIARENETIGYTPDILLLNTKVFIFFLILRFSFLLKFCLRLLIEQ